MRQAKALRRGLYNSEETINGVNWPWPISGARSGPSEDVQRQGSCEEFMTKTALQRA